MQDAIAYVGNRLHNDALAERMVSFFLLRGSWRRIRSPSPDAAQAAIRINSLAELLEMTARYVLNKNSRGNLGW